MSALNFQMSRFHYPTLQSHSSQTFSFSNNPSSFRYKLFLLRHVDRDARGNRRVCANTFATHQSVPIELASSQLPPSIQGQSTPFRTEPTACPSIHAAQPHIRRPRTSQRRHATQLIQPRRSAEGASRNRGRATEFFDVIAAYVPHNLRKTSGPRRCNCDDPAWLMKLWLIALTTSLHRKYTTRFEIA